MSTSVSLNAVSYTIPAQGEGNWGTNVSNYLIALSTGVLQKAGGTFTLTADVDFGATYGLKSAYYKSRNTPSTAGIVRLGNNESVGWRNAANSADLLLKLNASNVLEFNSSIIGLLAAALTASRALVSDGSGNISASSVTSTQLAYLASATGTTGTTSTNLVFSTSPTLVTPALGVASATSINKVALTAPATGSTLTIADGKTLTASNTLTMTATDGSTAAFGAGGTVVYETTTQTLSSKTLTAPVIDQANMTQSASATTPAAGKSALYVNSGDAKLHVVDSSGNDVAVGSGSSGRNYLGDWFDAAKDIGTVTNSLTDVVDTSDRTANKTTWGSSNTTLLTIARSASSPLRQSYSYLITEAGSSSGAFIESPLFTLDSVDLGKPVTVSFDVSGNSTSDYYQAYICRYDSNDVLKERIPIAGTASATSPYSARLPVGTTNFNGFFVSGSTSTDQYSLRIVSNNNSADSIKIDSLYIGPQSVVQGAAVTDPVSFTPTWTNLSNISSQAWEWWCQGKYMGIKGYVKLSGAVAGEIAFTIPGGYSMDTTSILTSGQNSELGNVTYTDSGTTNAYGTVTYGSSTTLKFIGNSSSVWNATAPITWAANDVISFTALVPIANWSSNVTMADRAVESYAASASGGSETGWDAAAVAGDTVYGALGAKITGSLTTSRTKVVRASTAIQPTDKVSLEYRLTGTNIWVDQAMSVYPYAAFASVAFGGNILSVSGTDISVYFNQYMGAGTTYNSNAGAVLWATTYFDRWRIKIVSGGAAVGYPVSTANVVGRTDGLTVGSGYIGEKITGTILAPSLTSTVSANAGSISLTAGVWLLVGKCYFNAAASTTSTQNIVAFSATTATIDTDKQVISGSTAAGIDPCLQLTEYIVVGSTTTYYMVANSTFAVSTMAVHATASTLYAIRIA